MLNSSRVMKLRYQNVVQRILSVFNGQNLDFKAHEVLFCINSETIVNMTVVRVQWSTFFT